MSAKIKHVAIISQQYALLGAFYETVFGMSVAQKSRRSGRAVTVGDGYVGLNINPRKAGRPAALDHFGVEVDEVEETLERIGRHKGADYVRRPSTRPFAGITANDPDGNPFDISQRKMENRAGVYVENSGEQHPRHISHVAIRTIRADETARFYADVLNLEERNAPHGDKNHYLTDGKVTLVLIPYSIRDYAGTNVLPTGMDHIGVTVDDLEACKRDIEEAVDINPAMSPIPFGRGKEGGMRRELAARQAPYAQHFLSDPDYTLLALRQG